MIGQDASKKEKAETSVLSRALSLADIFQKHLPCYGFERREGQEFMAYHVETAIKKKNVLFAEAGVGTGKTYAYLIPALSAFDWTSSILRSTLIISTNTIVLQYQLVQDINRLIDLLGIKIDADSIVLAKGKNNFLCPQRADHALRSLLKQGHDVYELAEWASSTRTGDRNEAPPCSDEVWQAICVTEFSNCNKCLGKNYCCYYNYRKKWLNARIVVTNHQQLLADALAREENPRAVLFRNANMIVIDEAHRFEEAAAQMLGSTFTFADIRKIPKLIKDLEQHLMFHTRGLGAVEILGERLIARLKSAVEWEREEENGRAFLNIDDALRNSINVYLRFLTTASQLEALAATIRHKNYEFASRIERVRVTLEALLDPDRYVFWAEMEGSKIRSINAVPRNMSQRLNDLLWKRQCPIVLTSATLTGGGPKDYSYWMDSLGVSNAKTMTAVPSPFNFRDNRIVYIPPLEIIPDHRSERFLDFAAREAAELIKVTQGNTLVLFNSQKDMRCISKALQELLPDYHLLIQGQEQEAQLVEKFKRLPRSVLLGTAYWEGLDVPGPDLISVICVKLPFPAPDPFLEAKAQDSKKRGLDPFAAIYLSNMLIKLKQGMGRLIRTDRDYGVLAILDKRAHLGQKSYSRLIHSLLEPSEVTSSIQRIREFISTKGLSSSGSIS